MFGMSPIIVYSDVTMNMSPLSGTVENEIYIQIRGIGTGPYGLCYLYWDGLIVAQYPSNNKGGWDYGFDISFHPPNKAPYSDPGPHIITAQLFWTQTGNGFNEDMTKTLTETYLLIARAQLKVTVKTGQGELLSGVTVTSTSQPAGQVTLNAVTDSEGSLEFNSVEAGSYTLMATKSGYNSASASASAIDGKTGEVTIIINKQSITSQLPAFPIESVALGILISLILFMLIKLQR